MSHEFGWCCEPGRETDRSCKCDRTEGGESPADGDNIVISLRTKYSTAERKYSVPVQCFQDLIVDLQRLNASTPIGPNKAHKQVEPFPPLEISVAAE